MKKQLPFKAWVLLPSFRPVEVELVEVAGWPTEDWYRTAKGKAYHHGELFGSLADAVGAGHRRLDKLRADIDKKLETLSKRRAALDKAVQEEMAGARDGQV